MNEKVSLVRRFDVNRTKKWIGRKAFYYPCALTKREQLAMGSMLIIDSDPIGDSKPFVYAKECNKHGHIRDDKRIMVFVDDLAKG